MENFRYYNPTSIHFGKNVINELATTVSLYGKKVLFVYGKNSIKNNGIYNEVIAQLKNINAEVFEYNGIKSNPIVEDVDAAAEIGRKNKVDVVLAVGGGSVIDSAKIISIAIPLNNPAWEFYIGKAKPQESIPLIAVLTLAATGTESNAFAVLQNNKTGQKFGYGNKLCFPLHSFLDPKYTVSVPKNYTAYGIADLMAHCLEAWFGEGDSTLTDRFIIDILKEAMEYGPQLLDNLDNYNLRAKIMYAATVALNGMTVNGKKSGDWGVHGLGHSLSALYDIPHGASLTIAYPAWLRIINDRTGRVEYLGYELFGIKNSADTIKKLEEFFLSINCPIRLKDVNVKKDKKQEIFNSFIANKASGLNFPLSKEDYSSIIDLMLDVAE